MARSCSRIENIVRRVAGVFVLGSLALGYWVHPGWYLFTAFVGLNLFQSSFTGFCPLELILQRMLKEDAPELPQGETPVV
jgi:hypothetical protein